MFIARAPWPEAPIVAVKVFAAARTAPLTSDRLEHPNLVTAFESGVAEGRRWIASELVLGKSLALLLERARNERRAMPTSFAVRLWADSLTALAWLDKQERVHGAISPGNILVTYAGAAKLADLGEARKGSPRDLTAVASAIAPLLQDHPGLAPLLSHEHASARAALDSLLAVATGADSPAPRVAVGRWISDLFANEKPGELAEIEALRKEEELPSFAEESTSGSIPNFEAETARSFVHEETIEVPDFETEVYEVTREELPQLMVLPPDGPTVRRPAMMMPERDRAHTARGSLRSQAERSHAGARRRDERSGARSAP